jgi:hypothetical protein
MSLKFHIDTSWNIASVDSRLFGSFVEHMGRSIYTGIFEPGHPSADAAGFRKDVADLGLKQASRGRQRGQWDNFLNLDTDRAAVLPCHTTELVVSQCDPSFSPNNLARGAAFLQTQRHYSHQHVGKSFRSGGYPTNTSLCSRSQVAKKSFSQLL